MTYILIGILYERIATGLPLHRTGLVEEKIELRYVSILRKDLDKCISRRELSDVRLLAGLLPLTHLRWGAGFRRTIGPSTRVLVATAEAEKAPWTWKRQGRTDANLSLEWVAPGLA